MPSNTETIDHLTPSQLQLVDHAIESYRFKVGDKVTILKEHKGEIVEVSTWGIVNHHGAHYTYDVACYKVYCRQWNMGLGGTRWIGNEELELDQEAIVAA